MTQLLRLGLIKKDGKSSNIFSAICPDLYFESTLKPSQFVDMIWTNYLINYPNNNAVNGQIFELIIASVLLREQIKPFHRQAKLAFVPGIDFDMILITSKQQLISLSLKTSFRERYKQADLEAMALKNVHRKAGCYLITLELTEAQFVKTKIETGEVQFLDDVIAAKTPNFDDLVYLLSMETYAENFDLKMLAGGILIN